MSIDNLKSAMVCEVCAATRPAPVAEPWHFRLNGFVLEGLREHGLLASLWCLSNCAREAQSSFFFLESQNLFFSERSADAGEPDAEIDLLVVADGVVRLCETKSSGLGINITKLAALALRIRPDVVTLAVMEPTTRSLQAKAEALRTALADANIGVDLMTLQDGQIENSTHLPSGTSFWVSAL